MSEKRFTYGETIDYNFFDVFEGKKYLGMVQRDSTKVVDRLNELDEENEQLRQFINKGRRLSVKELMDNANEYELLKKKIRGLEKENEQLKQTLENIGLHEKNDAVKMIEGKFFIRK